MTALHDVTVGVLGASQAAAGIKPPFPWLIEERTRTWTMDPRCTGGASHCDDIVRFYYSLLDIVYS